MNKQSSSASVSPDIGSKRTKNGSSRHGNPLKSTAEQDNTRQVALMTIIRIFEKYSSLEAALQTALNRLGSVSQRDRAAAYRLIICVLRKRGTLEALVEPFLQRPPPKQVMWIMLLGVAQILFLEVPVHAAIHTTVELARHNGFAKFTGLVNAVLRRIADQGESMLDELDQERLNIPVWLWQDWNRSGFYPRQMAAALEEAPLDITIKAAATIPPYGQRLISHKPVDQVDGHARMAYYRYDSGTRVEELPGFQEGSFWVQDFAATLPAMMLNVKKGERVADLCAAPGGKTAQLIQAGAQVVAVEKDGKRLKRLRENLQRLQMQAELVHGDAGTLSFQDEFDAVLLDAPCSATGIFRRHPDVLYLKREKDVKGLIDVQRKLVHSALRYLKPGGRLIYSVCSLQRAEAEEQAQYIATLSGVRAVPFTAGDLPFLPEALTSEGWIRTLPYFWREKGGMDGFFMARFIKE